MSESSGGDINYLPDTSTVVVSGSEYHPKQETSDLTREQVERRLKELDSRVWPEGQLQVVYLMSGQYRDLLQTALAAMDERDEILIAKERDSQMAIRYYNKCLDALVAEGRLLREALEAIASGLFHPSQLRSIAKTGLLKSPLISVEADRVRRLEKELEVGQVGHIIEFREDGWTIQHPLSCRPNLFDCPVNQAAERDVDGTPPEGLGRYVCGAEEGGRFWYDGDSRQTKGGSDADS